MSNVLIIDICNMPMVVVKYDVYIMESSVINGISIKIQTLFREELRADDVL